LAIAGLEDEPDVFSTHQVHPRGGEQHGTGDHEEAGHGRDDPRLIEAFAQRAT
jgi:hypothetical protein